MHEHVFLSNNQYGIVEDYLFIHFLNNTDVLTNSIFSRQASLARQAFLITPLHGARYKTGKNAYAKK